MTSPEAIRLTVREPAEALLDDPFRVEASTPDGAALRWRARVRDDDGRVWRAWAATPDALAAAWGPAKEGTGPVAALASLRPVQVDVRVEAEDGRAAARTLTRRLVGPGVKARRWRGPVAAHLFRPERDATATVLLDATAGEDATRTAELAAPLLASRGVLALVVPPPRKGPGEEAVAAATELLAAVPGVDGIRTLAAAPAGGGGSGAVPLPPNIPARGKDAAERAAAWDALLADLGARPRG